MQDIPRNELLDKLAAGWKVRRKAWPTNVSWTKSCESSGWALADLLADDWEGEPPKPVRTGHNCTSLHAFHCLKDGAAFIRRAAWRDKDKRYTQGVFSISIQLDELVASDWEVWE